MSGGDQLPYSIGFGIIKIDQAMKNHNENHHQNPILTLRSWLRSFAWFEWEAVIWILALILLACSDPNDPRHFTLYPPTLLFGIRSPGYNLGHAITQFFHGDLAMSFQSHPLGIPAALLLACRSVHLLLRSYRNYFLLGKGKKHDQQLCPTIH